MIELPTLMNRLLDQLDDIFAEEGATSRYHDLRDEVLMLVDVHPQLRPIARAAGLPV